MLERAAVEVGQERSTRAEPMSEVDARALLGRARRVLVARGRKLVELPAGAARPSDLTGPTGKVRAPLVLVDGTLLVGFHAEALATLVGGP